MPFVQKDFQRTLLFRGPLGQAVWALEYDFEGRFLMALVQTAGDLVVLYRFPAQPDAQPVVVANSDEVPALLNVRSIQMFDHMDLGRVWALDDEFPSQFKIFLVDGDNDGVFESAPRVESVKRLRELGLDAYEKWDSLLSPRLIE